MSTLRIGIAGYEDMKARSMRIARGEERANSTDPKVWFTSMDSFAKVLSEGNRALLQTIAERSPASLEELSVMTGRAKSNLSRTLKKMAAYGIVELERGERGRLAPRLVHDRIELELSLTH